MSIKMKLEPQLVNDLWESNDIDPEEIVEKHFVDSWKFYPEGDSENNSDYENQWIRNYLVWGLARFRKLNPPKILWDSWSKKQRSQVKTTISMLWKEMEIGRWNTRVYQLYSKFLEMGQCDIDDRFSIEMPDIEDLIECSNIKPSIHLEEMRKDVYQLIDEHNKQFMGEK